MHVGGDICELASDESVNWYHLQADSIPEIYQNFASTVVREEINAGIG